MSNELWNETISSGGRCWTRPLGNDEAAFYWDGEMNGACDCVVDMDVALDKRHQHLLQDRSAVEQAWLNVKARHPLMAAEVVEHSATDLQFVVREDRITAVTPEEIGFRAVENLEEITEITEQLVNGPRQLRSNMLASLLVISVPRSDYQKEREGREYAYFRLIFSSAHTIADGMASWVIVATFFNTLTTSGEISLPIHSLPKRLNMVLAVDTLLVDHSLSLPRRRWRRAIACTILIGRAKRQIGGHTMPNRYTAKSAFVPSLARSYEVRLDPETTVTISKTCRREGISMSHAVHVLSQLAHASVLRRLRDRKQISDENWAYRIAQPMHFFGPLNIRPFLNPEWLSHGGATEVIATGSVYQCSLPRMPSGLPNEAGQQLLMSRERFFNRCRECKRQMDRSIRHPLICEFADFTGKRHREERYRCAMQWREMEKARAAPSVYKQDSAQLIEETAEGGMTLGEGGFIVSNMVSSMSGVDSMFPLAYPLDSPEEPKLEVLNLTPLSRAFPGQLYAYAGKQNKMVRMRTFWDANVYDDALVMEWTDELGKFTRQYLATSDNRSLARL